jgi:uncharacterized membrane protein
MSHILLAFSIWLHSLATVVFIGYFVLLSVIFLPALTRRGMDAAAGAALSEISTRSRNWMYAALVVFALTGVHLMAYDPNYLGIGNFGNAWGLLMLLKHLVIVGMVAMGFWFNAILRVGPAMSWSNSPDKALSRYRGYSNAMAAAGVLVLLITAAAQLQ